MALSKGPWAAPGTRDHMCPLYHSAANPALLWALAHRTGALISHAGPGGGPGTQGGRQSGSGSAPNPPHEPFCREHSMRVTERCKDGHQPVLLCFSPPTYAPLLNAQRECTLTGALTHTSTLTLQHTCATCPRAQDTQQHTCARNTQPPDTTTLVRTHNYPHAHDSQPPAGPPCACTRSHTHLPHADMSTPTYPQYPRSPTYAQPRTRIHPLTSTWCTLQNSASLSKKIKDPLAFPTPPPPDPGLLQSPGC